MGIHKAVGSNRTYLHNMVDTADLRTSREVVDTVMVEAGDYHCS